MISTLIWPTGGGSGVFNFAGGTSVRDNNRWYDGPDAGELIDGIG